MIKSINFWGGIVAGLFISIVIPSLFVLPFVIAVIIVLAPGASSQIPKGVMPYDPEAEPTRRKVIENINNPVLINRLYREVKAEMPQASELVVWQTVMLTHQQHPTSLDDLQKRIA